MSTFREIIKSTPYKEQSHVLELVINQDGDSYVLENVVKLIGSYTFSIWTKANKNCSVQFDVLGTIKIAEVTTDWKKYVYTVKTDDLSNGKSIAIKPDNNTTTYYYEGFLSEGTIDNSWLPAPEDGETQMESVKSEFIQKADSIEEKVTANDGRISSLVLTVNGLKTTVSNAENDISTLQQTSSSLSSEIKNAKNDISSLQLTANSLSSQISNNKNEISTLKQTASEFSTELSNTKGDISKLKQQSDNFSIEVSKTIRTTVEEFYASSSNTSLTGGTWSTTPPTWTQGKYIWRRTLVTYANGKTEYIPSTNGVCITGNTGATGKGIKSTAITYQASVSGTTPPTNTWSATIPSVSPGHYLWSRTVITYTDNTTSTTYSVAYIPKNGTTGGTGTGVQSITQEYYLSTSKTSQVGGSWVTSLPTWSGEKYLWTRYKIIYKNPSSTSYTVPICDRSWESDIEKLKTEYKADLKIESDRITSNVNATEGLKKRMTTVEQTADRLNTKVSSNEGKISSLEQTANGLTIDVSNAKGDISSLKQTTNSLSTKVTTAEGNISTLQQNAQGLEISVKNAAKTATSFLNYDATNGLQIGNKISGNWSGYRTQIKSDSFNILDQNGHILAKYGANNIELGANSDRTIINLCGNRGSIWYNETDDFIELGSQNVKVRGTNLSSLYSIHENVRSGYNAYTNYLEMYSYNAQNTGSRFILNDQKAELYTKDKFVVSAPNGFDYNPDISKVWYEGCVWMDHTSNVINFPRPITSLMAGIVLVFSLNENGTPSEWAYSSHFIPKYLLQDLGEKTYSFILSAETFNLVGVKFLHISNTRIVGHSSNNKAGTKNGITYDNRRWALRRVYGV